MSGNKITVYPVWRTTVADTKWKLGSRAGDNGNAIKRLSYSQTINTMFAVCYPWSPPVAEYFHVMAKAILWKGALLVAPTLHDCLTRLISQSSKLTKLKILSCSFLWRMLGNREAFECELLAKPAMSQSSTFFAVIKWTQLCKLQCDILKEIKAEFCTV